MTNVSNSKHLTASAIRKLRNARKAERKLQVEAMNAANEAVVKAREASDDTSKLVSSVMRSAKADSRLSSTMSRERLKAGTYGQGFNGPRGFATPKGLVSKQEAATVALASMTKAERKGRSVAMPINVTNPGPAPKSQRFATDGYRVEKAETDQSIMRLSAPFKPKGAKHTRRQWMTVDLNPGDASPVDAALSRTVDRAERDARTKALSHGQSQTFAARLRKA